MTDLYRTKVLLIDDASLLEVHNLQRKVNQAVKHPEPVLKHDAPWDQDNERFSYANIVYDRDEKLFKMWYFVWRSESQEAGVIVDGGNKLAYATSTDGIHWERPELGLLEVNGSKKNNYVIPEMSIYGGSVIDDPSDIPARRYKMIFSILGREVRWANFHVPLCLAYSADGLHWDQPTHVNPVIRGISDAEFTLFYDPDRRKYQLYTRRVPNLPRDISLYESYDLVNWDDFGRVIVPDEHDPPEMYNFYNMATFPYEGHVFGMLNTQHTHPVSETYEAFQQSPGFPNDILGHVDIQLAYSRDGRRWARPLDRSPVIPCGKPGETDFGGAYPSKCPVVIDGETWIYYTASKYLHCWWHEWEQKLKDRDICCLMLAKMPEDHWVSLDAGSVEGWLLTKPYATPSQLLVNADAKGGSVEAEFLTPYGRPVEGFTRTDCVGISGNGKDQEIKWKGATNPRDLNEKHRGGLCLKFYLKNAKLYSYSLMEPDPNGTIKRYWDNAHWNKAILHRSDNWGCLSTEPAIGLPPYIGPGPKKDPPIAR